MILTADFLREPGLVAVLDALEGGGHRAFPVGGCVRNAALGVPVADVDVATDARPDRVTALAMGAGLKAIPTGAEHGTITVVAHGTAYEVTTFRRDVETDGRRAVVAFSERIEEDAARRDFTMNALYCTRDGEVIDPTGQGLADLAERRLRFVGRAEDRIAEDYLRILRFFRFFAIYGRAADAEALAACHAGAPGLALISRERIGAEMRKLLAPPDPAPSVALMSDVLEAVLPGADGATLPALIAAERDAGVAPDWPRRLAALGGDDPTAPLRLSRQEAKGMAARRAALADATALEAVAYHNGEAIARDVALIRTARGEALPPDWPVRIARAATAPLPVAAADLPELSGPSLGQALKTAEAAWIASGFTAAPAALIAAAKDAS